MKPTKPCYRHPAMKDTFVECVSKYPGSNSITVRLIWWNVNEYEGNKPYVMHNRPIRYKIPRSKWLEFEPVNWRKEKSR